MQSQVRFNRAPENVQERFPEKVPGGFVQRWSRFKRVWENVSKKVPGSFGANPSQD